MFWREIDEVVLEILSNEDVAIGGDMSRHVNSKMSRYEIIYGGYSMGFFWKGGQ